MRKRIVNYAMIICICFALLFCAGCSSMDRNKYSVIERPNASTLVYNGVNYYKFEKHIFGAYSQEDEELRYKDYILISWEYNFPFTKQIGYYSYTIDNPDFIVEPNVLNNVYFREDYDVTAETFVVEETDIEIVFSNAFIEDNIIDLGNKHYDKIDLYWHSKTHYALRTNIEIVQVDNVYYINIPNGDTYQISDEFLLLLRDNEIVN